MNSVTDITPIVSIIIPCYNQAQFLPDAINSIKAQTMSNWECIIVNDGSVDDTYIVAEKLAQTDLRISVINQVNKGLSGARNSGITQAKGDYIQFLDADDLIEPDKLFLQIEELSKIDKKLCICYSDYRHCPENNINETIRRDNFPPPRFKMKRPLYDIAARWESEFSIPVHAFLFDARLFKEKNIRFDENLPNHEDWDCWMQIFDLDPVIKLTTGPLAIYRLGNNSMCMDRQRMWEGFSKAINKQRKIYRNDPIMRKILLKKLKEMKKAYIGTNSSMSLSYVKFLASRFYRRTMPWPIQKLIASTLNNKS